jgi:hypothetical protein
MKSLLDNIFFLYRSKIWFWKCLRDTPYMGIYIVKDSFTAEPIGRYPPSIINKKRNDTLTHFLLHNAYTGDRNKGKGRRWRGKYYQTAPVYIFSNKNTLYGQVKNQFNYRVRDLLAALLISRAPYVFPVLHFRYLNNGHYKDNNF